MTVLVDSSPWVPQLRKSGDPAKRDRVNALLESGEAAWCPVVRLELRSGVTNDAERKTLRRYEALLPDYEIAEKTWERATGLPDRGRASGLTVPLADLLVFACARGHGLEVAHDDEHFDTLATLEVQERLVFRSARRRPTPAVVLTLPAATGCRPVPRACGARTVAGHR